MSNTARVVSMLQKLIFMSPYSRDVDATAKAAIDLLMEDMEPVVPIKTCKSKSEFGIEGFIITGTCPVCGAHWLNNGSDAYCGGCGRPLDWKGIKNARL